jgi:hypothetical protein|tara:strand:- start:479 stop:769 length:291 start_codon:yes stop_codon:yes gene_type:complete
MAKYKLAESAIVYGGCILHNEDNVHRFFPDVAQVTINDLTGFPLESVLTDLIRVMGRLSGGYFDTVEESAHMYFSNDRSKIYADGNGWFALYEEAQ